MGFLIGPVFFFTGAWFLWGPETVEIPQARAEKIDRARLTLDPPRTILGDPPVIRINEFDRTCMDCHRIFLNKEPNRDPEQHQHIRLRHGINTRCYDCHDLEDRNVLVFRDGKTTIPFTKVPTLCAQCHPDKHEDWTLGLHGRQIGYWDTSKGPRKRFICTECHDPHRPRHPIMDGLEPLPAPNTLRMGERGIPTAEVHHETRNPLRRNQ